MEALTCQLPGGDRLSTILSRAGNDAALQHATRCCLRTAIGSFATGRYSSPRKCGVSSNKRVHLTARPGTRLALSAPRPHSPHGHAQGARPSRPAGDAQRWTDVSGVAIE